MQNFDFIQIEFGVLEIGIGGVCCEWILVEGILIKL